MPELPEVEVTRLSLQPKLEGQIIRSVKVHNPNLRWPVPADLNQCVHNKRIVSLVRRAKYLQIMLDDGLVVLHLGMSGYLRVCDKQDERLKHDHVCFEFDAFELRLNDARRFGACLYAKTPSDCQLLAHLGPEPLSEAFDVEYLSAKLKTRKSPIKSTMMDQKVVVGVGNIYVNEALHGAKIHPLTLANALTRAQIQALVAEVKKVIARAIECGGTTLKDFKDADGKLGYFQQELNVYGVDGPCSCGTPIERIVISNRATYFCPSCQLLT